MALDSNTKARLWNADNKSPGALYRLISFLCLFRKFTFTNWKTLNPNFNFRFVENINKVVPFRLSACGMCGEQHGTGTGFSAITSVFPCQLLSTGVPLLEKMKKKLIIFFTGLYNNPQGAVRP
jgi:hypothetical protein